MTQVDRAVGRRLVRLTGLRGAALLIAGPLLAAVVFAGAAAFTAVSQLRFLLGGAPLLVAAGAVGLFAALPAVPRPTGLVATASLLRRSPFAVSPRTWLRVLVGAASLLVLLAALAVARRPERLGASGFVRWRASIAEALLSGFPDRIEAVGVVVAIAVLLVVTWAALVRVARIPAMPEARRAESEARRLAARVILGASGGAVFLMLGVALSRIGGSAWGWGTATDLAGAWTDPTLAIAGGAILSAGIVTVLFAFRAWLAAVVLVVRMLRADVADA